MPKVSITMRSRLVGRVYRPPTPCLKLPPCTTSDLASYLANLVAALLLVSVVNLGSSAKSDATPCETSVAYAWYTLATSRAPKFGGIAEAKRC
jgi:hypothetical protein